MARVLVQDCEGVLIRVRATPRADRDCVSGIVATGDGPAVSVRVRALAEGGSANRAIEQCVARWAGVAKSDVSVVRGMTGRLKLVRIVLMPGAHRSADVPAIKARVQALASPT